MSRRSKRGSRAALAALLSLLAFPALSRAQACCAGAGAVTPGRLALHEDALVGAQIRGGYVFGAFDAWAVYHKNPPGASEWDLEEDLFGALRVAPRAQIALLLPAMQTHRRVVNQSETGGGIGDVNLSGRYDFVVAGESFVVPGIALLAGVSAPTGTPADAATRSLATDATGIGAYQLHVGLALEQTVGPWLFGVSGLMAKRTSRTLRDVSESRGVEWTALASAAYTLPNDAALALVASYAAEGSVEINGQDAPDSSRRVPLLRLLGLCPLDDKLRFQAGVLVTPPFSGWGKNHPGANVGLSFALVRTWS